MSTQLQSKYMTWLKKYDFSFFGLSFIIFLFGLVNLYSATHATSGGHQEGLYQVQFMFYLVALFVGVVFSFIRPSTLFRYSYIIYAINIVLLILVILMGSRALGAQRWLAIGPIRLQPSEFMKISIVLALSRWFSKNDPEKDIGFKEMVVPFIMTMVPACLIIIQPDLGTGLVLLLIFAMIIFYRRLKWKTILILALLAIISGGIMFKYGLKEYQKQRIITFLDPWGDARGSGYNAIQSEIAIGSGLLFGKGFKKSSQASLSYLPENHTDFVFSIYNEEHGFFGSLILIGFYIALFLRYIWLSSNVLTFYDSIAVIGIMSIFFWHTFINMSMVTGLMPIVGLPLPLMSYGGSSLMTFCVCCGIATSISNSRNLF